MKRILLILSILALAAGCSRPPAEAVSAAMEMYEKYAKHSEQLTVAFIGNFEAEGSVYNTVMFQAQDSAEWAWLKEEFGIVEAMDLASMGCDGSPMVMTSMKIDSTLKFSSNEELQAYADSMARELVKQVTGEEAGGEVKIMAVNPNADIQSQIASGMAQMGQPMPGGMPAGVGMMVLDDSVAPLSPKTIEQQTNLMNISQKHKGAGYIISSDAETRTLWLFFYDTPEAQRAIMARLYHEGEE